VWRQRHSHLRSRTRGCQLQPYNRRVADADTNHHLPYCRANRLTDHNIADQLADWLANHLAYGLANYNIADHLTDHQLTDHLADHLEPDNFADNRYEPDRRLSRRTIRWLCRPTSGVVHG
jgi:hypothetical protein